MRQATNRKKSLLYTCFLSQQPVTCQGQKALIINKKVPSQIPIVNLAFSILWQRDTSYQQLLCVGRAEQANQTKPQKSLGGSDSIIPLIHSSAEVLPINPLQWFILLSFQYCQEPCFPATNLPPFAHRITQTNTESLRLINSVLDLGAHIKLDVYFPAPSCTHRARSTSRCHPEQGNAFWSPGYSLCVSQPPKSRGVGRSRMLKHSWFLRAPAGGHGDTLSSAHPSPLQTCSSGAAPCRPHKGDSKRRSFQIPATCSPGDYSNCLSQSFLRISRRESPSGFCTWLLWAESRITMVAPHKALVRLCWFMDG